MFKKLLLLASLIVTPALAQSVQQSGTVTPRQVPVWVTSGVIGGSQSAPSSSTDSVVSSLGVTNNGGAGFCVSSDRLSATGRNQLCFGASTAGAATISVQNYGTALPQGINFVINGTPIAVPTGGGAFIFGNAPFAVSHVPCFVSTAGIIQDCGLNLSNGTITAGIWQGTPVDIPFGGTNANSASGARTNLGLGTMATQNANNVAVTGGSVTGMPSPANPSDVAIKSYVDATSSGLNILAPSRLATAAVLPNTPTYANGTLGVGATLTAATNTTLTVDGTSTALNDVILVKNQAAPAQNGIYTQTQVGTGSVPWILTRATYFDQAAEMRAGSYTFINGGVTNLNSAFTLQAAVTTVGTDPLNFVQFSAAASGTVTSATIAPGTGVSVTGTCTITASGTCTVGNTGVLSIAGNGGLFTLNPPLSNAINALILNASIAPQGRITLSSGNPVMQALTCSGACAGETVVFYTPYRGNLVPIYDGTNIIPTAFAEVSQSTTDTTKSPAAVAASSVYDIFCWVDSGTNRCTRGPAWTNSTTRGYTLTSTNGILLNTSSIANGPTALRGTFVGTIASNGSLTIDYIFGASASGGTPARLMVWNAYNRVSTMTSVTDNGAAYLYSSATVRQARGGTGNQINFVLGLQEDGVSSSYACETNAALAVGSLFACGLGFDVTNAYSVQRQVYRNLVGSGGAPVNSLLAAGIWNTPIGVHFISANESADGANSNAFDNTNGNVLSAVISN